MLGDNAHQDDAVSKLHLLVQVVLLLRRQIWIGGHASEGFYCCFFKDDNIQQHRKINVTGPYQAVLDSNKTFNPQNQIWPCLDSKQTFISQDQIWSDSIANRRNSG